MIVVPLKTALQVCAFLEATLCSIANKAGGVCRDDEWMNGKDCTTSSLFQTAP